jgi:cytochrome c553
MSHIDLRLVLLCMILSGAAANAQTAPSPSGDADWSKSVAQAQSIAGLEPNVERGQELYAVCAECHLASGVGDPNGTMPQLAGQHSSVLIKQLMDIQSGLRMNPAMYPFVARLDDPQDLVDLAYYIESFPLFRDHGQGPGLDLDRGQMLYVEHCASCHGERGEGNKPAFYPKIAGQHYRYLVRQIIDIAGGRRGNANPAMTAAVAGFSARDVANVADYVSRIPTAPSESRN